MGIWNSLFTWLTANSGNTNNSGIDIFETTLGNDINPANGLPMIAGCCGVDIEGNPYGTDSHHDDSWTSASTNWDEDFANPSWDSSTGNSWEG